MNSYRNGNQYFKMNDTCLVPTDIDGSVIYPLAQSSGHMQSLLCELGFGQDPINCHVAYTMHTSAFTIETGKGDDIFRANNITAYCLSVYSYEGDGIMLFSNSLTPTNGSLGVGRDGLTLKSPADIFNGWL